MECVQHTAEPHSADASGSLMLRYAYTSHFIYTSSDQISHRWVVSTQSSLCPGNCCLTCRAVRVPGVIAKDQLSWHSCAVYPDMHMITRQPSPRMAVHSDFTGTGGAQLPTTRCRQSNPPRSLPCESPFGGKSRLPTRRCPGAVPSALYRDVGRSVSASAGVCRLHRDSRRRRGGSTSDLVRNSCSLAMTFEYFDFAR